MLVFSEWITAWPQAYCLQETGVRPRGWRALALTPMETSSEHESEGGVCTGRSRSQGQACGAEAHWLQSGGDTCSSVVEGGGRATGVAGPAVSWHLLQSSEVENKNASSRIFSHVPEAPRSVLALPTLQQRLTSCVHWEGVKNVQVPVMWKGKPPSLCAERQWSRHKGQSWLLRAPGCQSCGPQGPCPQAWRPSCLQEGQSKRGNTTGISESRGCLLRHGRAG